MRGNVAINNLSADDDSQNVGGILCRFKFEGVLCVALGSTWGKDWIDKDDLIVGPNDNAPNIKESSELDRRRVEGDSRDGGHDMSCQLELHIKIAWGQVDSAHRGHMVCSGGGRWCCGVQVKRGRFRYGQIVICVEGA